VPHVLIEEFEKRRTAHFEQEIAKRESREKNRATERNPIASNINRACVREMVLAMKHPVEKIVRDPNRLERFEDAVDVSKRTRRDLEDLGFDVTDVEASIPPVRGHGGRVVLTGIIDFMIRLDGKRYAVEVKSPHPLLFERIETLEDLERWWWTRKWVDQIIAYLYAHGMEEGFILLYALGAKKWIPVNLNEAALLERAESALQLVEKAADAYHSGYLPGFAKDPDDCRSCWAFGTVCQPPIEEQAAGVLDDEEFYAIALRAEEIKPYHSEYEALWKRIREVVKATGLPRVLCRDVAFSVAEKPVKEYTVKARVDRIVKMFRVGKKEEEGAA
jgi:hypothetical protein